MSARGAADFLTRATAILATIFVLLSILLAGLATQTGGSKPIDQSLVRQAPTSAPPGPGESAPISGGVPVVPAPADTAPAGGVPFQTAPAQPAPSAPASSAPASSQSSLDQSDHGQPDSGQSGTDQAGPKNGAAATAPKDPDRRFANERFTRPPAPAEPAP